MEKTQKTEIKQNNEIKEQAQVQAQAQEQVQEQKPTTTKEQRLTEFYKWAETHDFIIEDLLAVICAVLARTGLNGFTDEITVAGKTFVFDVKEKVEKQAEKTEQLEQDKQAEQVEQGK